MTQTQTAIEIPLRLQPGEIWFYLEFALIDDVPALYQLLAELDLKPQPAFMRTAHGTEMLLLLAHEQRQELNSAPNDYYWDEQKALANTINTDAMHCRFRRTNERTAIAA